MVLLCGLTLAIPCQAGLFGKAGSPCSQCGCGQLKKVCRLVADVKKVTEFKYTVEEEEVCLLGKSVTEERVVEDSCSPGCQRCETVQTPRCGRIVCKKKLKKTSITVEKPTVKCIMETICCQCGCRADQGNCSQ
jgi:hypothetical protein